MVFREHYMDQAVHDVGAVDVYHHVEYGKAVEDYKVSKIASKIERRLNGLTESAWRIRSGEIWCHRDIAEVMRDAFFPCDLIMIDRATRRERVTWKRRI